jgi:mRNA interferase HigB
MRVIARSLLKSFWLKHADAEQPLKVWFHLAKRAVWRKPQDIKAIFSTVDFLSQNRVVFDIKGNKCRLVVAVKYEYQTVYIRFIGTHAQYDKIDAVNI